MTNTNAPARPADRKPFIAVNLTPAMSGYFATLYDWSWLEGGTDIHGKAYAGQWFPEPYETGMGRYATWAEANAEGERWAAQAGLEFRPATSERVAEAEASAAVFRARVARIRELREAGMGFHEASEQANREFPR